MRVILSIKDDKELRDTVKDMIRGQLAGITREFIDETIAEVASRRAPTRERIEDIVRSELQSTIRSTFAARTGGVREEIRNLVKAEVMYCVRELLGTVSPAITQSTTRS